MQINEVFTRLRMETEQNVIVKRFVCDRCLELYYGGMEELTLGRIGTHKCDECGKDVDCDRDGYHFIKTWGVHTTRPPSITPPFKISAWSK